MLPPYVRSDSGQERRKLEPAFQDELAARDPGHSRRNLEVVSDCADYHWWAALVGESRVSNDSPGSPWDEGCADTQVARDQRQTEGEIGPVNRLEVGCQLLKDFIRPV